MKNSAKRWGALGERWLLLSAVVLVIITVAIILFIAQRGLATFFVHKVSPLEFFFSTLWRPDRTAAEGGPRLGIASFIVGSVLVTGLAVLMAAPLSILTAFFIVEIAPGIGRRLIQPAVEILAGIPSVVYGWVGLSLLVPFLRSRFGGTGFSVLAGALVLSVMITPTIVSVACEAIRSFPREGKEAALALGSTRWQTLRWVVFPAVLPGLITAVILGMARAFGEALAVQMVIGNTHTLPRSLLDQTITLTSGITLDMGYTIMGTAWNSALWTMALVLLLMSLAFILISRAVTRRGVLK
ncbi:MAG: phosphate ABC transporter permease subunit PstC [Firmicutes bacterium]|jgi:phosphate transport system permease protein|nr:phosphate ABC transporter permease subunit PstC [Bacillota bacterium]